MVIQRWQTVFLLIVAVMMGCFTFCSLGQVQMSEQTLNFTTLGFTYEGEATGGAPTGYFQHTWVLFVISLVSAFLPLINMFMYKNMKLQKTVCAIEGMLLLAILAAGCAYGYYNEALEGNIVSWSSIIISWPVAFVADMLAWMRINSDQKLLRSADRLR